MTVEQTDAPRLCVPGSVLRRDDVVALPAGVATELEGRRAGVLLDGAELKAACCRTFNASRVTGNSKDVGLWVKVV